MTASLKNHPANTGRHAGILLPLFSMRSEGDWGIGDFDSLARWTDWTADTGTGILQILPIHEMSPGDDCPYRAISAFALDPVFISVKNVPEASEAEEVRDYIASPEVSKALEHFRKSPSVLYTPIKELKYKVLWMCFSHFAEADMKRNSGRAAEFRAYRERTWWLADYSTFRAMKDFNGWKSWLLWDHDMKTRDPKALHAFREKHERQVLFFEYLQWLADTQFRAARERARRRGVWLFGDLPFMMNPESADAWSNQDVFDVGVEIGAPPDQFSTEGQCWGLPAYNWYNLEKSGFAWWRKRMGRALEIYDLLRLDHLVGFFRTWIVPRDKSHKPHFDIEGDGPQQQRGERFLKMVIDESGHGLPVAEDLGVIPNFVRHTLDALHIPGYKVMRWERDWEGTKEYRDPKHYPKVSLATSSTHDTETVRQWWEALAASDREFAWRMLAGENGKHPRYSDKVGQAVIKKLLDSNSSMVLFPLQDILGLEERINTPGTVGPHNWTWRIDRTEDKIGSSSKYKQKLEVYKWLLHESGRNIKS
ncbi:MAG: 4-alpha-glucanotransferase [Elusimicrobia bacterium]|nr:4-alpha-glucanotransferase [Elusimicrobiota bacterium]